jgi:hypothetical protein
MPFIKLFIPRIYSGFQKSARSRLFRFLLPGAAPLGDFPYLVNTGGVVKGLFGYRFNSGSKKPLHNGSWPYPQNLGYLCNGQSFHMYTLAFFNKKINSFNQQVIDKHVVYNYDVFIASHSNVWQNIGDRDMAKIINFIEGKAVLDMDQLNQFLKREAEKQGKNPPKKKAKVISALPGEIIPPEYPDFRPFLQRDGLILLSWARWNNRKWYGLCYRVNWVKSRGKCRHYASGFAEIPEKEQAGEIMPIQQGDIDWSLGIAGTGNYYISDEIADVVFIAAPELNRRTIPAYIELLKAGGVTVDFGYEFSLGAAKELEFKREEAEIAARLENIARDGGLA